MMSYPWQGRTVSYVPKSEEKYKESGRILEITTKKIIENSFGIPCYLNLAVQKPGEGGYGYGFYKNRGGNRFDL